MQEQADTCNERGTTERRGLTTTIVPLLQDSNSSLQLQNSVQEDKEELLEADMNLQTIVAIMGIALFIISMVRGCGGMKSGGCGMDGHGADQRRPHD